MKLISKISKLLKGEATFPVAIAVCFQSANQSFAYITVREVRDRELGSKVHIIFYF